jgi:hypothetical protein
MRVGVGGIGVDVAVSGIGVEVAGAPHPTKNKRNNPIPIVCCRDFLCFIVALLLEP